MTNKEETQTEKTTTIICNGNYGYFICGNCKEKNPCSCMTSVRMGQTDAIYKKRIKCYKCNKFSKIIRTQRGKD